MKIEKAIRILEEHNKWRRGAEIPQQNPAEIGIAIDTIITCMRAVLDTMKQIRTT